MKLDTIKYIFYCILFTTLFTSFYILDFESLSTNNNCKIQLTNIEIVYLYFIFILFSFCWFYVASKITDWLFKNIQEKD